MSSICRAILFGFLFWLSNAALADTKPPEERATYRSVRLGACGGWSTECMVGSLKFEFAPKYVGVSLSSTLVWGAATVKIFPLDYRHSEKISWRPYAYYGGGYLIMAASMGGGGVGADVLLLGSKRLLLQPSLGFQRIEYSQPTVMGQNGEGLRAPEPEFQAAGQLSVMLAF